MVAQFDFAQFEEDLEVSSRLPYCQVVSPPNVKDAQMKKLDPDFGLFIPLAEAESAGFVPNAHWKLAEMQFGDDDAGKTEGYISRNPRFCIVHQSQLEAQQRGSVGYRTQGLAYDGGKETALMQRCRDEEGWRVVVRYLIVFLNDDNTPMHTESPIQFTGHGGFGGSFGAEVGDFYKNLDTAYFKAAKLAGQKVKGNKLGKQARAFGVLALELGYHRTDADKAPFVCPVARLAPAVERIGESKDSPRQGGRTVKLTGTDLGELLLNKSSEAGQLISDWFVQFQEFVTPRTGDRTEGEQVSSIVKDAGSFDLSTVKYLDNGNLNITFFGALETYKCTIKESLQGMMEGDRLAIEGMMVGGLLEVIDIVDQSAIAPKPVPVLSANDVNF